MGGVLRTVKLLPLFVIAIGWLATHAHADAARETSRTNEAQVRQVIEPWAKAFRARDLDGIMSVYAAGDAVVGYDLVPPLQYRGSAAYREDYAKFLAQYAGPIDIKFHDVRVVAGEDVAFVHALERIIGTLKDGQKSEMWVRATSGLKKIHGRWLIVHDHISVPADFETGKAVLDLKP
ncbi:MAG: nuclear transport factor 2 family protein [Steroidobacteraceae bacterium]